MKRFIKNKFIFLFMNMCLISWGFSDSYDINALCKTIEFYQKNKFSSVLVKQYVFSMTEKERIAQLFLLNLQGNEYFSSKTEYNENLSPGGYLLFSYNISNTPELCKTFTDSVKNFYIQQKQIPPFMVIDHEGGEVNRLRKIGVKCLSEKDVSDNYSIEQAYDYYLEQGKVLRKIGIDINLSPIIEPLNTYNEKFLADRSFGNEKKSTDYGTACVKAYIDSGIIPVIKHYPGNTNDDPHFGIPVLRVTQDVYSSFIFPFKNLIKSLSLSNQYGILLSHIKVDNITDDLPSCFSKNITNQLQNEFGFSGLIFSDDVYMDALVKSGYSPEKSAELAIVAGTDIIMMSTKRFIFILNYIKKRCHENPYLRYRIIESCNKILQTKLNQGFFQIEKNPNTLYLDAFNQLGYINKSRYYLKINNTSINKEANK